MEDIVIEQGAGAEPALAAPAGAVSGTDGAVIVQQPGGEPVTAPPAGAGVGVPSGGEDVLSQEVRELWAARGELLAEARRSKEMALAILLELGRRLSGAKESLARPGRNGGWSSFARSLGFSRAEADGLVRRYRRTLKPQAACTVGAEAAAAGDGGEPAAAAAEARPEAAGEAVPAQATDQASLPSAEASATAGESPASAPAADPAPQPSGETPAAVEEPAADAAAAPLEAGQAPAAADAGTGGVT